MLPEHKLNFSLYARGPWEGPIGMETAVAEQKGEWCMFDTCDRCLGHVSHEEILEDDVSKDKKGGMLPVD